jgi:hypothetical protein
MPDFPLRLPTESTIGRDGQEASVRLINGYPEQMGVDQDGKSPYVVYAAPGLTRWDSGSFSGAERGAVVLDANNLIYLLGSQLVKFDANGAPTVYGTIIGSDRVTMARNRNGTPQIGIVTSTNLAYYVLQGSTLTQPAEPNLPPPNSIAYLKGNFFYGIPDGRIFSSPQEQATGISALAFAIANADAGGIVRIMAHVGYLYIFGPRTLEIWQYTGDVPFPLQPVQQYIALGLAAQASLAETDKGLVWVDHKGFVRFGRDGSAQRISTHSVERAIAASGANRANLTGSFCTFQGHECYVLSHPTDWTWIYDFNMQRWIERKSYGQNRWLASTFAWFNGDYICGSNANGRLYKIDPSNFEEDHQVYIMEIWCENSHNYPNSLFIDSLNIDIVSGVGNLEDPEDINPMISIDYSDDGGKNFYGERMIAIGAMGNFRKLVRTGRWGRVGQKGRIWRFRASAGVMRAFIQATLRGRPGL